MERLTSEQLEEIRKRAEAATPGPWSQINGINVFTDLGATNAKGVTADHNDGWCIADTSVGLTTVAGELVEMERSEQFDNATFIAHARQDVPALLAEVERLQKSLDLLSNSYVKLLVHDIELMDAYIPGWRAYAVNELRALKELLLNDEEL